MPGAFTGPRHTHAGRSLGPAVRQYRVDRPGEEQWSDPQLAVGQASAPQNPTDSSFCSNHKGPTDPSRHAPELSSP
jgi:hypothetical protein